MSKEIIYSFKQYQEKYTELLEAFKDDYDDNEEEDFLNEQIKLYIIYIDNVTFTAAIGLHAEEITYSYNAIRSHIALYNNINEIQEKITSLTEIDPNYPSGYQKYINVSSCKKYERSFVKILEFLTIKKAELEVSRIQIFKNTEATIQSKSLLFDGKPLNLLERFKIANKVLDIDKKIRTLNIADLQKYQLLAYVLGCNKDNARDLMNGSYNAKARDLSTYFTDLDLNK
jgi:hypothetical protein